MKHLIAVLLLAAAVLVCTGCKKSDTEKPAAENVADENADAQRADAVKAAAEEAAAEEAEVAAEKPAEEVAAEAEAAAEEEADAMTWLERLIYILVGVSAVWALVRLPVLACPARKS